MRIGWVSGRDDDAGGRLWAEGAEGAKVGIHVRILQSMEEDESGWFDYLPVYVVE